MFNIFNKKPKELDPDFERAKQDKQFDNNKYVLEELRTKYQEKLTENPIKILSETGEPREIKNIERLTTNPANIEFGNNQYFCIYGDKRIGDELFKGIYQTDENSINTIITIMNDLIERSDYPVIEKTKMQSNVINHLKDLIKKD